jgi:hypothetical protein
MSGSTDGSGSDAGFATPTGIAVDSNGYVYVTDSFNYNIRKITPEGVVSTLAGGSFGFTNGTGGSVAFIDPYGVAVDSNGNVYIADAGNNRIRKMITAYEVKVYGDFTGFGNGSSSWQGATNILDVTGWESNTALVDVSGAFNGATSLIGTTAASWDVSRLTNMSYMFFGASSFTTDLSGWANNVGPLRPADYANFLTSGTTTNPKSPFYIGRSVDDGLTADQFTNLLTTNIGKPNPPFQIDNAVYGTVGTRLYKIKNSVVSTLATFASPAIGAMYRIDSKIFGIQGKKLFSCDVSSGDAINSSAGTFIGDPSEFMTLDASGNLYAFDNSGNLYRYSRRGTPGLNIIFTDLSNAIIYDDWESFNIFIFKVLENIKANIS